MDSLSEYNALKERARYCYRQIEKVRCPALNYELVFFTSEGFNIILYIQNLSTFLLRT